MPARIVRDADIIQCLPFKGWYIDLHYHFSMQLNCSLYYRFSVNLISQCECVHAQASGWLHMHVIRALVWKLEDRIMSSLKMPSTSLETGSLIDWSSPIGID